jgi:serine/threonine-protein kinase HipA
MVNNKRSVFVYADWESLKGPILMGTFSATNLRGKEIFSFEYNNDWLKSEYVPIEKPRIPILVHSTN